MRILVDIDGVVGDLVGEVLARVNSFYGTEYTNEMVVIHYFFDPDGGCFPPMHCRKMHEIFNEAGLVSNLNFIKDSVESLQSLKDAGHEIVWVTAPHEPSKTWCHDRINWLRSKLSHISSSIILTKEKHLIDGDVLIDDTPKNVRDFVRHRGKKAFLLAQPWNKDPNQNLNQERYSWKSITSIILNKLL